ncbi:hypothetical protein [Zobellia nedashkovskayae]|uniref:hypothetical protein n=1 Tax=Zobellia nedashkovskayae TaxID=2779510 RepID=UPI00188BB19A|nr:hypothetical protein [Zobellia nedashkovskayae]
MNIIFSDNQSIDGLTLKKLMLTGNEITFVNRPSISLAKDVGTVAVKSDLVGLEEQLSNDIVKIKVIDPPTSVFSSEYYKKYFAIDQNNIDFKTTVLDGIKHHWIGSWLLDSKGKKDNSVLGFPSLKDWVLNNQELILDTDLNSLPIKDAGSFFELDTKEDALSGFRTVLWESSLRVTAILYACNSELANPISISPYLDKAINIRRSDKNYVENAKPSRSLGYKVMDTLISDEALEFVEFPDILKFREETKGLYQNYIVEMNKLEAEIIKAGDTIDINHIMDVSINPEMNKIRNELLKVRDSRFKKVLTMINNGVFTAITTGALSFVNLPMAILGFVGTQLKSPKITQEIIEDNFNLKELERQSHLTYLLKLNKMAEKNWLS